MSEAVLKTGEALATVQAMLDAMKAVPGIDQRALSVARTNFEAGFLWIASAAEPEALLK
jgi:hypothetical protein